MDALKNLEVWQKYCRLSVNTYTLLGDCRNHGFADQLGRAALFIASNIAEGYEREGPKDRARFLKVAKGSCAEAWTQFLIGVEAGILPTKPTLDYADEAVRIRQMLFALIRHIESK